MLLQPGEGTFESPCICPQSMLYCANSEGKGSYHSYNGTPKREIHPSPKCWAARGHHFVYSIPSGDFDGHSAGNHLEFHILLRTAVPWAFRFPARVWGVASSILARRCYSCFR